jgi:hypothetical protein
LRKKKADRHLIVKEDRACNSEEFVIWARRSPDQSVRPPAGLALVDREFSAYVLVDKI